MKKTLSLLLVFALMLSILIIPAAAAAPDEEIVEPQDAVAVCLVCGVGTVKIYSVDAHSEVVSASSCVYQSGTHNHIRQFTDFTYRLCNNCGDTNRTYWSGYAYTVCRGIYKFTEQH